MPFKQLLTLLLFTTISFGTYTPVKAGDNGSNNPALLSGFCDIPVDSLLFEAYKFIGTPYHFGGISPNGFDCSGLVKHVFGKLGIDLPRTSGGQATDGEKIAPKKKKKGALVSHVGAGNGDLVFFGKSASSISHVGIVVSEPGEPLKIVHSASSVGVTVTDVFSSDYWAPKFKFIKRIIPFWGNDEPVRQLLGTGPKNQAYGK